MSIDKNKIILWIQAMKDRDKKVAHNARENLVSLGYQAIPFLLDEWILNDKKTARHKRIRDKLLLVFCLMRKKAKMLLPILLEELFSESFISRQFEIASSLLYIEGIEGEAIKKIEEMHDNNLLTHGQINEVNRFAKQYKSFSSFYDKMNGIDSEPDKELLEEIETKVAEILVIEKEKTSKIAKKSPIKSPSKKTGVEEASIAPKSLLSKIHDEQFLGSLVGKLLDKIESRFFDFKSTYGIFERMHLITDNNTRKKLRREVCYDIASFANAIGGIIVIGVSDKIPRRILGVNDIENKINTIANLINSNIDNKSDFFEIMEIKLLDNENKPRSCILILIAQTTEAISVKYERSSYKYPKRIASGKQFFSSAVINKQKLKVKEMNYEFINFIT